MVRIEPGHIHIWKLFVPDFEEYVPLFEPMLNVEELCIAAGRATEIEKHRYIIVKALVRLLLGMYTGLSSASIVFAPGAFGKPVLSDTGGRGVLFNITHAGDAAAVALSAGGEIGVDIEKIRPDVRIGAIIDYAFTEEERDFLERTDERQGIEEFFSLWSRKEALIKTVGGSIASDADRTSVLGPCDSSGWREAVMQGDPVIRYLYDFIPFPGYSGAVCTDTAPKKLHFKQLSLEYFHNIFHNSHQYSL